MGGSSSSPYRLCNGFLQEIGRRLRCLSTPQYQRQHSIGRKHDLLWILSFHIREPDLGWHSRFFDRSQKAPCFSLNRYEQQLELRHMRKVNVKDLPEQERRSPKGTFGRASKNVSIALGREPESFDLSKRHPFDLALVRIPKGKTLCPYHAHAAESELYLVVSGRGSVRDKDGTTEVGPADAFFFQPGEAHQISNAGDEDFVYYVIADNPRSGGATGDSCYYPDSGKWAVAKEGCEEVIVKGTDADYFDGEE
jgi:uncharacterized cupin superfamily protein